MSSSPLVPLGRRLPAPELFRKAVFENASEVQVSECVIVAVPSPDGSRRTILGKNRDRPYTPNIRIHRTLAKDGVTEIVYLRDQDTGWAEGMNSAGIGIVNSALMVGRDEQEKKIAVTTGVKSKDGDRIVAALEFTNIEDAVKSIQDFNGGVKGHTIVSDGKVTYTIECTSSHQGIVKKRNVHEFPVVRTNHGHNHTDAGYQGGPSLVSSILRKHQVQNNVRTPDADASVFDLLSGTRYGRHSPNNPVRDTQAMSTTSQMLLDLTNLEFHFRPIKGKVSVLGVQDDTPRSHETCIRIKLYDPWDRDGYQG